jgi:hypothetical protein
MNPMNTVANEELNFIQPKATQQYYELRTKDKVYGTLNFPKLSGSLAEAESSSGKWTFKRVGFFQTKITIRNYGEENDIAVFKPNMMSTTGLLEMTNGKKFQWESSNFWATRLEFKNEKGETLVSFRSGVEDPKLKDWFKTQARIEISTGNENLEELSLLILLGWYLIIVLQMDSATSAVVAAAT